jgi:hypothetical protein
VIDVVPKFFVTESKADEVYSMSSDFYKPNQVKSSIRNSAAISLEQCYEYNTV